MSVIQVEDLVTIQLRYNYLDTIKDGVGERLITINDAFLNTPGFKAAGWRSNPAHIRRTHSPPIPTAITSEYFQAPTQAAGLALGLDDEAEEGGLVTGGGFGETVQGLGIATKRRRRREQIEEEDSSDLSDDSDEDDQRAAQAIKFAKMPIRTRSGSSPLRSTTAHNSSIMTSPPGAMGRVRRGSQPAVDTVKERARRDTVTSSEMSSETDFDNSSALKRQHGNARISAKGRNAFPDSSMQMQRRQSALLEEEEEDDSDASEISAFAGSIDSTSMLESINDDQLTLSPSALIVGTMPRQLSRASPRKIKPISSTLQALPPPRPISMIQPKSLLAAAIRAKRTRAATPFEKFAALSGQGDPDPLRLRIWAPFAQSEVKYFEVLISRIVHSNEGSGDRAPTVADLIGLGLWRYTQEKLQPELTTEQLHVNRWTLRLIDDEEVDFDFPALDRTKPVSQFTTVNNRAARARSGAKTYDEFGLVQATEAQFQENQKATPQFKQEDIAGRDDMDVTPRPTPNLSKALIAAPPKNPLLFPSGNLRNAATLADAPALTQQTSNRHGIKKLLRIHILSADTVPGQMITLDITTDTYLAEVLDMVCKKRNLDKANHVLKLSGSSAVVFLDRTVDSIGHCTDLDLDRRRFATDGPLTMTGSGSPSSQSPSAVLLGTSSHLRANIRKPLLGTASSSHPLASSTLPYPHDSSGFMKKYTVWRKQPMRFVAMNERVVAIDGEYLHIMPSNSGKTMFEGQGKTTTVHFSNVIGCKVTRRHPTNFKVVVFRATESKRYDFEARNAEEAREIVAEISKGIAPYQKN